MLDGNMTGPRDRFENTETKSITMLWSGGPEATKNSFIHYYEETDINNYSSCSKTLLLLYSP